MTRSFGSIVPPARKVITVQAKDSNGAELSMQFRAMDIPTAQEAATFGYEMIKKYTPLSMRRLVPAGKGEQEPEDFPAAPNTGYIKLSEASAIECANMFFAQHWEKEGDELPFQEFVYMSRTAPNCFMACQKAMMDLGQGAEDLEGNLPAGGGAA